jgi:hypothetical protein
LDLIPIAIMELMICAKIILKPIIQTLLFSEKLRKNFMSTLKILIIAKKVQAKSRLRNKKIKKTG